MQFINSMICQQMPPNLAMSVFQMGITPRWLLEIILITGDGAETFQIQQIMRQKRVKMKTIKRTQIHNKK